jgi:hypothetical protein
VPIYRLLQDRAFDPELVRAMTTTFEEALRELKLSNREDPITQTVARIIIECAERGIRDPVAMRGCIMEALRT